MYPAVMARPPAVVDAFSAIGHPRRRALLTLLAAEDRPVTDLVAEVGLSQSAVSEHLAVLRTAGLVTSRRRGREHVYRLEPAPLREVDEWIASLGAFWDDRLDRLGQLLHTLDDATPNEGDDS
jgi:DNA-binding transcriptional ArsR family regulator